MFSLGSLSAHCPTYGRLIHHDITRILSGLSKFSVLSDVVLPHLESLTIDLRSGSSKLARFLSTVITLTIVIHDTFSTLELKMTAERVPLFHFKLGFAQIHMTHSYAHSMVEYGPLYALPTQCCCVMSAETTFDMLRAGVRLGYGGIQHAGGRSRALEPIFLTHG